jgi:hypothetical protein
MPPPAAGRVVLPPDPIWRRLRRGPEAGEDHPPPAVEQLAYGVEVAGVACGLGDHVQHDLAQAGQPPARPLLGPLGRWRVQRRTRDDLLARSISCRYKPNTVSGDVSSLTRQAPARLSTSHTESG